MRRINIFEGIDHLALEDGVNAWYQENREYKIINEFFTVNSVTGGDIRVTKIHYTYCIVFEEKNDTDPEIPAAKPLTTREQQQRQRLAKLLSEPEGA